ncbi:uncharacterized protein LOC132715154 [Ruditapes philippinarum]|uniref:uncharacterized protein LOC132715154 n=1 Tax=Ruditapes philippinarum TaxID=129788 RepID=UPI00295B3AC8|nr:uncharacterized protein LOC132715154 [Ruditapes philippinarum]
MSENKESVNSSSPLTRKIGVGLTRTNLSPGSRDVTQRSPRDRPLLTPSRLIISGSSLGTSRTNSDSYASGYNRLGGLKNISAPNISSNILGSSSVNRPLRKLDIDQVQEPSLRKNLSATNTEELLKNDQVLSGVNVQRSQSANRGVFNPGRFSQTNRTVGLAAYKPTKQDEIIHDVSETTSTKIENYDLDLEQDEEDAIVEVKDSVDGAKKISVEVTSPSSPSKDSGYNSPRTDPNMEPFNSSVLGSRSPIKSYTVGSESPSDFQSSLNNSSYKPERPVRSKHSAKKKSIDQPVLSPKNIDQSEDLSQSIDKTVTSSQTSSTQSPWQHVNNTIQYDTNLTDMVKNKEINSEYNLSRKNQPEDSVSEDIDHRSRSHFVEKSESQGEVDEENTPVAKPRVHRRRTRRSISFRHLVRNVL